VSGVGLRPYRLVSGSETEDGITETMEEARRESSGGGGRATTR